LVFCETLLNGLVHCIAKTFPDWKHMKHLLKENGRVRTQGNRGGKHRKADQD